MTTGAPAGGPAPHQAVSDTIDDDRHHRQVVASAPRPYLFVVLEGARPLAGGARFSLEGVAEIHVGRGSLRQATVEKVEGGLRMTLLLPSPLLSRLHARLRRSPAGWHLEDAGSRNGSYLNGERVSQAQVGPGDLVELGHAFLALRTFEGRPDEPARDLEASNLASDPAGFRTLSPTVAASLESLRRVARSTIGILVVGETGTGKEVLARAIHELSGRPGPFIAVNCNTLQDNLAESQLFGHVKGAFSGAVSDSVGFVRASDGGTLLLDEVGDLGSTAQGALLRVLQEREVVPVGRAHPQRVDVRFLATSPRPLDPTADRPDHPDGERFRSDLFARLSGFVHQMTPLRERQEDLGLLVATLLGKAGVREGDHPRMAPDFGLPLLAHDWPLNVRELEQLLTRTWLLAEGGLMQGEPLFVSSGSGDPPAAGAGPSAAARELSEAELRTQQQLAEALAAAHGNVTEAARALGKGRVQVHRMMKRLGLDARRFRS